MTKPITPYPDRVVFLDYLRVTACIMVIMVHCIEPFYLGNGGTLIRNSTDAFWSTFLDSALRASIPLFVLTSSYLLFPVKDESQVFFRRRFTRILFPFLFWSLFYILVPMWGSGGEVDILGNAKHFLLNFNDNSAHLWFVYMILGLYIVMPMLSPWVRTLSVRGERIFIGVWLFTTLIPFLRKLAVTVFGRPEVWGEANWNEFGAFYYISGFVGLLVLGHYFRTYVKEMSWGKTLAIALPLWGVGYFITAGWFWWQMPKDFPVEAPIDLAVHLETSWGFTSFGVILTAVAYFLVARKFTASGAFYRNIVVPLSKLSYGIYLMHMAVLLAVFDLVSGLSLSTPLTILLSTVCTFTVCAVVARLVAFIPGSRYIIG